MAWRLSYEDFVACAYAQGFQSQNQGIQAVAAADAIFGAAILGKGLFKSLVFLAFDVPAILKNTGKCSPQLSIQLLSMGLKLTKGIFILHPP